MIKKHPQDRADRRRLAQEHEKKKKFKKPDYRDEETANDLKNYRDGNLGDSLSGSA